MLNPEIVDWHKVVEYVDGKFRCVDCYLKTKLDAVGWARVKQANVPAAVKQQIEYKVEKCKDGK